MKTKIATHSFNTVVCAGAILLMTASVQAQNLFVANQAGTIFEVSDGTVSTFAAGIADPVSLAVNAQGDVFEANGYTITEFMPGGGQNTFSTGYNPENPGMPSGTLSGYLAINSSGDLFASSPNDYIFEFTPGGTEYVSADPYDPEAMAFDGAGNMFVQNFGGSPFGVPVSPYLAKNGNTFASGSYGPLACDNMGDLFAGSAGGIIEFTPTGQKTFYSGQGGAFACDAEGDLYMTSANGIVEFAPDGTDEGVVVPGLDDPVALAFQPAPEPSAVTLCVLGISACLLASRLKTNRKSV